MQANGGGNQLQQIRKKINANNILQNTKLKNNQNSSLRIENFQCPPNPKSQLAKLIILNDINILIIELKIKN